MTTKANIGDVFLIPLDGNDCAGGQIISAWNDELYLAVFDSRFSCSDTNPRAIVEGIPAFLVLSLDAKIWHRHWPVIGNVQDNLGSYPQPAFKVRQNGVIFVESRDRTTSRRASPEEAETLQYRTVSSPAGVENAVKAYFGIGEWMPHYNEMRAEYAINSSRII